MHLPEFLGIFLHLWQVVNTFLTHFWIRNAHLPPDCMELRLIICTSPVVQGGQACPLQHVYDRSWWITLAFRNSAIVSRMGALRGSEPSAIWPNVDSMGMGGVCRACCHPCSMCNEVGTRCPVRVVAEDALSVPGWRPLRWPDCVQGSLRIARTQLKQTTREGKMGIMPCSASAVELLLVLTLWRKCCKSR